MLDWKRGNSMALKSLTKTNHIHKYKKIKQYPGTHNHTYVFACQLPDCRHIMPLTQIANKASICWDCGEPFIITGKSVYATRPKCKKCIEHSRFGNPKLKKKPRDRTLSVTKFSKLHEQLESVLMGDEDDE